MKKIIIIIVLLIIIILDFVYFSNISHNSSSPDNSPSLSSPLTITLYYYSEKFDKDQSGNILCSNKGLVAIKRKIPHSDTIINDTIRLLIKGKLSSDEKNRGITTEFPLPNFEFVDSKLQDNILTLRVQARF
jgi:hypothetical protein